MTLDEQIAAIRERSDKVEYQAGHEMRIYGVTDNRARIKAVAGSDIPRLHDLVKYLQDCLYTAANYECENVEEFLKKCDEGAARVLSGELK